MSSFLSGSLRHQEVMREKKACFGLNPLNLHKYTQR